MKKSKHRKPSWKKLYEQADDYLQYNREQLRELDRQIAFLDAFIEWKGLGEEYRHFRENAHVEYDPGEPFPRLVL